MERAIQKALGRGVSKQFTTDNCNQPAKNSHFCLWNSPDRGIRVKVSGDVTAKARKVRGICTVIVTGKYFVIDDETRGKLKYRTRGLPRFCR